MNIDVFVGPTLGAEKVRDIVGGVTVHPPIAHGDLFRLRPRRGGVVVIIDGFYHHRASVRHKEILAALHAGVHVIGCSSMGALRAAELHAYGMIGNGVVFDMYRSGVIDSDEEVAVAHGEPPEYRRFSEPMVNIRVALTEAGRAGILTAEEVSSVLSYAVALTYPKRTWRAIEDQLRSGSSIAETAFERLKVFLATNPAHADRKAADAIDTLGRLDPLVYAVDPSALLWRTSKDWRTRHLYEWRATFSGEQTGDGYIGHGAVLRYQQLYCKDFPQRWRTFALNRISATTEAAGPPIGRLSAEDRAIATASRQGMGRRPLTPLQEEEWLTERETTDLTSREAILRVLTRSYRPSRGIYDLVEAFPDLIADAHARRAVHESSIVNTEVASWLPGQATEHIRESVILDHLAKKWGFSPADSRTLRANARDRGFAWIEDAVESARQFFLREHLLSSRGPEDIHLTGEG